MYSVSCNRADDPARRHLSDPVIVAVGNEEIARTVHSHTEWCVQIGSGGRTPVSAETLHSVSRNRTDGPTRSHLADSVVKVVGDEETARTVHRHTGWGVQISGGGYTPISAEALYSVSSNRTDDPARRHL